MTKTQNAVLGTFFNIGALTDHQLIHATAAYERFTTPSGIRTRRSELVKMGLVEAVGKTVTPTGTKTTVWNLTPKGVDRVLFGV